MHVAINMTTLNLTHIHINAGVLEALVYLECSGTRNVLFANTNSPTFLLNFTTAQLNNLYHNATGADLPLTFDDRMRRYALAIIIDSLQERKINENELAAQIEIVEDDLNEKADEAVQFEYNPGSKIPKVLINCLPALSAAPATIAQLTTAQQVQHETVVTPTVEKNHILHHEKILKSPKTGVCASIWSCADKTWEDEGKPTDVAGLKELLRKIKNILIAKGINKNTISVQTRKWAKTCISDKI